MVSESMTYETSAMHTYPARVHTLFGKDMPLRDVTIPRWAPIGMCEDGRSRLVPWWWILDVFIDILRKTFCDQYRS